MSLTQATCQLPFAHLNLRRNPFGEFSEEERTILALVDIEVIVQRLGNPKYAVQFIGDKGCGKTTHLLTLYSRFSEAGYVHIPEGERAAVPSGFPILIDEAQRLTRWQQFRVFRSRVPLVLGTHRDFTQELCRAGRTVETVEVARRTNEDRLCQLLNDRIRWVRRGSGPIPAITRRTATDLRHRFGPNIRGILHELYDLFQNLSEIRDV